jgi:hypothetical protein
MPRGNDSAKALQELSEKFGQGVGNAEHLIEANLAQYPEELRRAELLPRDPEATDELRKNLGKLKGPHGEEVIDAAVRRAPGGQPTTVIVYVTEDGRYHLGVLDDDNKAIEPKIPPALQTAVEAQAQAESKAQKKE